MKKVFFALVLLLSIALVGCDETATIIEPELYEYSFELDGGVVEVSIDDTLVEYGKTIQEPSVTNAGFELVGWYSDSTHNVLYDFSQPVFGDLTIYALWEQVEGLTIGCQEGYTLVDEECAEDELDPLVCDEGYTLVDEECVEDEPDPIVCDEGYVLVEEECIIEENPEILRVVFVPSRSASEILDAVGPLEVLLQAELADLGFVFEEVIISVSTSYEAGAESVASGFADVIFLPGMTYVEYAESLVPILAAARDSINKDYENAADWNDGLPTMEISGSSDAVYYRSLLIVGQSSKGRELAAIVNSGGEITWDDIKDANFCHRGSTSSAGYVYPNAWLNENFGKSIDDMPNAVETYGYGNSLEHIEAETCDIAAIYADGRMHHSFSTGDIFLLTDVIGVTGPIPYDGIFVGEHISLKLAESLQIAFMNLINDSNNENIFDIFSHRAYFPSTFYLYEYARKVHDFEERLD